MSVSNAVAQNRISRVVGYQLTADNSGNVSVNLPQRIALLAEANHAQQSGLNTAPREITSAQEAGKIYGYGSPIYDIARILFPFGGGGVSVPVIVYPQAAAVGATFRIQTITVTGTATAGGTHYVKIAGRDNVDGATYAVNIAAGDDDAAIAAKINDCINAVLGAPVTAAAAAEVVTVTTKWKGLTAQSVGITIDTNNTALGITYAVAQTTAGIGTPDIAPALAAFGQEWNTIVINSYGAVDTTLDTLEAFNGKPDKETPTGRYDGIIMKPFIALTGSVIEDPSTITDDRSEDVTIAICPAPLSPGMPMEAAANMAVLFSTVSENTPHLDVAGLSYKDMPMPANGTVIQMGDYAKRDSLVKKGCSTVNIVAGVYQVQDFVTTYHPAGEIPLQFNFCRNLVIDFNYRYAYYLAEQIFVVDHVIASDDDVVTAEKVVKPKTWKAVVGSIADDFVARGMFTDAEYSKANTVVALGTNNPNRLETKTKYKRSGFARVLPTTAAASFNLSKS